MKLPNCEDLFGHMSQEVLDELSDQEAFDRTFEATAEDSGELDIDSADLYGLWGLPEQ